jgi:hypothetical protein
MLPKRKVCFPRLETLPALLKFFYEHKIFWERFLNTRKFAVKFSGSNMWIFCCLVKPSQLLMLQYKDVIPSTQIFCDGFCLFLFSWRYNPLWLYFHSPVAGFSLLVFEVS